MFLPLCSGQRSIVYARDWNNYFEVDDLLQCFNVLGRPCVLLQTLVLTVVSTPALNIIGVCWEAELDDCKWMKTGS